jgi:uncharacterized protein with von Willebrand factor type A (vWA) domain
VIETLTAFVDEMREVGVPVSMVEALDAAAALEHADLSTPEGLRAVLGATLIKSPRHRAAFEAAFDVFFGDGMPVPSGDRAGASDAGETAASGAGGQGGEGDELAEAMAAALAAGDHETLRRLVRRAVDRLSGMEPGRPVGGRYYQYRVLSRLDLDRLAERLFAALGEDGSDPLGRRLESDRVQRLLDELREEIRREILRRLIDDRGAEAVARTVRQPLVEDIDLMHATREEIEQLERAVAPLARKLGTRLAQRRKRGSKGRLDVRRTIRRSLSHGGALVDPRFKPPRRSKPELVLLCDVSGSMATFARFTMQLTYAIANELSKVRTFAFIDGLDEVTDFFGTDVAFEEGLARMGVEADLVRRDGHSDYGRSFREFRTRFGEAVSARTTILVTGDARNNYRESGIADIEAVAARARALFWLNPESERYWDTGDSIMGTYRGVADRVHEVRTLRQLETFVAEAALPVSRRIVVANPGFATTPSVVSSPKFAES